jgi:hypothetical protein
MPYAGSRMLRDLLAQEGLQVERKHVSTLMKCMSIEVLYRKPRTTTKHPQHRVYPYPLRGLCVDRPNQVYAMHITYIPMARGLCTWRRCWTGTRARSCLGGPQSTCPASAGLFLEYYLLGKPPCKRRNRVLELFCGFVPERPRNAMWAVAGWRPRRT